MARGAGLGALLAGFGTGYSFVTDANARAEREEREKKRFEHEEAQRKREAAWQTGRDQLRQRYMTEPVYTYEEGGEPVQVGTRPRQLSFADNLKFIEDMAAHDFTHGKLGLMDFASAKDKVKQMQAEGMLDAHRAFVETGDIRQAAETFNATGKVKVKPDSLRAVEVEHPAFGKYVAYKGEREDGRPFEYDPIKASVLAGGAKGFLAAQQASVEATRVAEKSKLEREKFDHAKKKDADELALKTRDVAAKEGLYRAHAKLYGASADQKGGGKFEFKPVDQARIATQVAQRMQRVDPISNKEVDHDATPEAIALAGDLYRQTKGEIGLDQAVGLVARPGIWMSNEDAEKRARADLKKMERKGLFGGGDVVLSKGKGGDKTISADDYVKQRTEELLEQNRKEIKERALRMIGVVPAAASGLPRGASTKNLSPAARAVLEAAMQ